MDKLFEKKNLGIPVTLLSLLAYFIGYYISQSYGALLVAIIFAGVVFALDFDDKVKAAVKQAYVVGFFFRLIYLLLDILGQFNDLITPTTYVEEVFWLRKIFSNLHHYALILFNIVVLVVFIVFVVTVLLKKDLKLSFIFNLLGEGAPKQPHQAAAQQVPPMYQQAAPMPQAGQPMNQQPVHHCPKCGAANREGVAFCASCGNKL